MIEATRITRFKSRRRKGLTRSRFDVAVYASVCPCPLRFGTNQPIFGLSKHAVWRTQALGSISIGVSSFVWAMALTNKEMTGSGFYRPLFDFTFLYCGMACLALDSKPEAPAKCTDMQINGIILITKRISKSIRADGPLLASWLAVKKASYLISLIWFCTLFQCQISRATVRRLGVGRLINYPNLEWWIAIVISLPFLFFRDAAVQCQA